MTQERHITNSGYDKQGQRPGEYDNRKERGYSQKGGRQSISSEVFADVIPFAFPALRKEDGIQGKSVDRLAGTVSKEDSLPTCKIRYFYLDDSCADALLKTKKTKKAKSSLVFVELLIWSKKQKWS